MKILVIGGYGNFGGRLVHSLLAHSDHQIIIAGRSDDKRRQFIDEVPLAFQQSICGIKMDVLQDDIETIILKINPDIVVNATGPFQLQSNVDKNYRVAFACINSKSHYLDLADNRKFVVSFSEALDKPAKESGLMLVSGASTVPGLSVAVIEEFISEFSQLDTINFGITPGNKTERGVATVSSILSYTGKEVRSKIGGAWQNVFGWQGLERYDFGGPLGKRWMSFCEIPDLDLLPARFPEIQSVRFKAGLELSVLHLALYLLSGLVRIKLIKDLTVFSVVLTRMSEWFFPWGSADGGMYVELEGKDENQREKRISWQVIALNGSGPNIPTISAELIIRKMAAGDITVGAMPCVGLFSLKEFFDIAKRWGIYQRKEVL